MEVAAATIADGGGGGGLFTVKVCELKGDEVGEMKRGNDSMFSSHCFSRARGGGDIVPRGGSLGGDEDIMEAWCSSSAEANRSKRAKSARLPRDTDCVGRMMRSTLSLIHI